MLKKLCIFKKLFPMVLLLIFLSCATTQKQPIVKIETIEKPEITNNLDNSLSDLTTQITNSITEDGKKKIAVIEFSDLEGNVTQFGKYLAEELITRLFRTKKFDVLERQLLNKIISEQKLSLTGIIDENSAKELGRVLGVDAIVSGTITEFDTDLKVNARIISAETGKVFGVAASNIVKDEKVRKLIGRVSVDKKPVKEINEESKSEIVKPMVEVNKFIFKLIECKISDEKIVCDLLITNDDQEDRTLSINARGVGSQCRIVDDYGNEYIADIVYLGSKSSYTEASGILISGIPTRSIIVFKNILSKPKSISVLELGCAFVPDKGSSYKVLKVQLRNIPLLEGIITLPKEPQKPSSMFR